MLEKVAREGLYEKELLEFVWLSMWEGDLNGVKEKGFELRWTIKCEKLKKRKINTVC